MGPTPPFIEVVSPCRCEPLWAGCCGGGGGGGGGGCSVFRRGELIIIAAPLSLWNAVVKLYRMRWRLIFVSLCIPLARCSRRREQTFE